MPEAPELPPRPSPARPVGAALAAWVQWVGLGRIIASAVSMVIVIGGAVWLLRAPDPPTEAAVPLSRGSAPVATLAPPPTPPPTLPPTSPPTSLGEPITIVVDVAGAVVEPGVRALTSPARVADAVAAAGGPSPEADLDALNLAAPLADGQRVYVPRLGEVDPASVPSGASPAASSSATAAGGAEARRGPVDLNTATAADLESLPGIGPATAAAIVEDRTRNGPFSSIDELERVPGIGPAKLAALRDQVTV